MLTLTRPLGRLPFFFGVSLLNGVILLTMTLAFTLLPTGSGHLAVLVAVGGLHILWFILHARRFADAGRRSALPLGMAFASFAVFAIGYMVFAALWSVPEVQREAFQTAGGIGGGMASHVETSPLILETGRALASLVGAAGAVVVTGLVVIALGIAALVAGSFSLVALVMPTGAAMPPRLPGRTGFLPFRQGRASTGR